METTKNNGCGGSSWLCNWITDKKKKRENNGCCGSCWLWRSRFKSCWGARHLWTQGHYYHDCILSSSPLSSFLLCIMFINITDIAMHWSDRKLKVRVWDSSSPAMDQLPAQAMLACHHLHLPRHHHDHHLCQCRHNLHHNNHHDCSAISLHMSGLRPRLGDSW